MRPFGRKSFTALLSATVALASLVAPLGAQQSAAPQTRASLYSRIGGYDVVARFVDITFPRVATHPQLKRLFQGHSSDSQMRQRQLVVDAFCHALGGPCLYFGRPMKPLHAGLGITTEDWAVFMGIVSGVLGELRLPVPEQREFLALLEERFRDDVVEAR